MIVNVTLDRGNLNAVDFLIFLIVVFLISSIAVSATSGVFDTVINTTGNISAGSYLIGANMEVADYGLVENDIPQLTSSWSGDMDADRLTGLDYLNYKTLVYWANITSKFITAVDDIYIYMSGTTATLNETKLNATIKDVKVDNATYSDSAGSANNWDSIDTPADFGSITASGTVAGANLSGSLPWTDLYNYVGGESAGYCVYSIGDSIGYANTINKSSWLGNYQESDFLHADGDTATASSTFDWGVSNMYNIANMNMTESMTITKSGVSQLMIKMDADNGASFLSFPAGGYLWMQANSYYDSGWKFFDNDTPSWGLVLDPIGDTLYVHRGPPAAGNPSHSKIFEMASGGNVSTFGGFATESAVNFYDGVQSYETIDIDTDTVNSRPLHIQKTSDDVYASMFEDNSIAIDTNYAGFAYGANTHRLTGYFYRNLNSTYTGRGVVEIKNDHASDDQATLKVYQDGSGAAIEWIGGTIVAEGNTGQTGTATVRDSGGAADCNLVFTDGIMTSTTCSWA